jgi:hypothetical protein
MFGGREVEAEKGEVKKKSDGEEEQVAGGYKKTMIRVVSFGGVILRDGHWVPQAHI